MDKAAAEAKQIEGAQVEQITDNNGLQAVKVTFDSGILFTTGNATLSAAAKSALSKFANNVLNQNRDMDVSIYGYTDNQGWRNSTAEQSRQKNLNLSQERAQSVASYLLNCGVSSNPVSYTHIDVYKRQYNEYADTDYSPKELREILDKRLPTLNRWRQKQETSSLHHKMIQNIIGYINGHLTEVLNTDTLSSMSGLSKFHFRRVFRLSLIHI